MSDLRRAIYRYLPPVRWRKRAGMMDFRESFYDAVTDGSSAFADMLRTLCQDMMRAQIPDRPDMWKKLTPTYNPGCKRVIISDDYYPAVASPKTTLETNNIKRITETGIELENGEINEHDMIVLATGFRSHHSGVGIAWLAVTAVAMFALAEGKRRVGAALDNPVLVHEASVTVVDGLLACAVLAGLLVNSLLGWWWADPLAAFVIVFYALREARAVPET